MKVIFLGRKSDSYSKKILKILKEKYKSVDCVLSKKIGDKLPKKFNKQYDIAYSFRSYILLKPIFLKKIKKFKINFHPAPPKYRGTASVSMALKNNDKFFGCTAHFITKKIDYGKIIEVKKFAIKKIQKLSSVLMKTHKESYKQAVRIINLIYKNNNNIDKLFSKSKYKWSKKYFSIKNINKKNL